MKTFFISAVSLILVFMSACSDVENRLTGGCMSESYFLAGMLRYKNIPARVRAGYFKDIRANEGKIRCQAEKIFKQKFLEVQEPFFKKVPGRRRHKKRRQQ